MQNSLSLNHGIYFQGTLALELLQQAPDLDAILVPVSGGGMISGIAIAAKSIKQNVKGKHYWENQIKIFRREVWDMLTNCTQPLFKPVPSQRPIFSIAFILVISTVWKDEVC